MSVNTPLTPITSPLSATSSQNYARNDIPLVEIFKAHDERVQNTADFVNALTTRYQLKRINEGKTGMVRWGEKILERLLRNDIVCMGCHRRKRIGLVFCWVCWDKGCNADNVNSTKYFRTPCKYAGLSLSSWLGIYSEHTLEDERHQHWNHNIQNLVVPEEHCEDPLYDPVTAPVAIVLTSGQVTKPLRPQIRFVHSNVCAPQVISPSKQLSQTINNRDTIQRKDFIQSLNHLSKPLSLNNSQQERANILTIKRLWFTIIPMIARIKFLKEHTPSIKRNEYLVFKSLMRIKMAKKAKVFGKLIHIVEVNKLKRAQEVQASRMARRIFFRQQSMAFHRWLEHATKQRRGKEFIKERLGGIKRGFYMIWKEKWLVGHRAKVREAKARAFIKRYQLQACVKCLYCLREHANLQMRLRAFINKWKLQPAAKCIEPWRDLVHRNKRVRAFIKRQLGKIEVYCFEVWHMKVQDAIADRKHKLKSALYRFRKQKINAAFNTFVLFRDISLASKDLQRVYRGFKGRLYAKQQKAIELEKDTLRAAKESMFIEKMTSHVDNILTPLEEHKIRKTLFKQITKKINDRYNVEKAEPLSSADPNRRFKALFEIAYEKLDFMDNNYILAKDLNYFWHAIRKIPPQPHTIQNLNLILIKHLKEHEAKIEKIQQEEEAKLKKEAALREKKKKGAIFEKKRKQQEEAERRQNEAAGKKAEEIEEKTDGDNVDDDEEEDSAINKEHLLLLSSPEWNEVKIPKEVIMNVATDENFQNAIKTKFIERKVHYWKSKSTESPIYTQLIRCINFYYAQKSYALNRELFRYQYEIKPRVICKRCKLGFRFASQLNEHLQNPQEDDENDEDMQNALSPRSSNQPLLSPRSSIGSPMSSVSVINDEIEPACKIYIPPDQLVGTAFLKDVVDFVKITDDMPQLNEQVLGYPQIRHVKGVEMLQIFRGTSVLNDGDCYDNVPLKDVVRVMKVEPFTNMFHTFPQMRLTIKSVAKFRTRNGMKKKVVKSYKTIIYLNETEFQNWCSKLKLIARKNSIRRRKRRQARIDRKEKRRVEARIKREAEKLRRKEMLKEAIAETKRKNKEKAALFRQKRMEARERKRQREIERGIEENNKQIALQEALEMEHLVDQAEHFLNELKEAQEAVSKAQYLTKYSDLDSEDQSHTDNTSSDGEEFWGEKHDKDKPNEMYFMRT